MHVQYEHTTANSIYEPHRSLLVQIIKICFVFISLAAFMLIETILLQDEAAPTRQNQLSMEITRTNIHCS